MSRVQFIETETVELAQPEAKINEIIMLKLKEKKNVHWKEGTVNNENMGKRKSKICCIYHKPRLNPDDSSSDESCDSCDEKGKNAYERPNHYERKKETSHSGCGGKCSN